MYINGSEPSGKESIEVMAWETTRFEVDPSYPRSKCEFTDRGWFYKITLTRGSFGKFILVDGAGLIGASSAITVVPNSDAAFIGKTGSEPRRKIAIYGLTEGNCMVEFREPGSNKVTVYMQVWVGMSFVKPSAASAALIGPGLPTTQYQLPFTQVMTSGPADALFDRVPSGTMHVVLSTHGQMDLTNGITMSIAGGLSRANCAAVFGKLKPKASQGVVWISGCDAGSDKCLLWSCG